MKRLKEQCFTLFNNLGLIKHSGQRSKFQLFKCWKSNNMFCENKKETRISKVKQWGRQIISNVLLQWTTYTERRAEICLLNKDIWNNSDLYKRIGPNRKWVYNNIIIIKKNNWVLCVHGSSVSLQMFAGNQFIVMWLTK